MSGMRVALHRAMIRAFALLAFGVLACGGDRVDADAGGTAQADAAATTRPRVDAAVGLSDAAPGICFEPGDCVEELGLPALPEFPCGDCWASCSSAGACVSLCVEAADCVFLSGGCGPQCESLCSDEHPCFAGQECVDGICQAQTP